MLRERRIFQLATVSLGDVPLHLGSEQQNAPASLLASIRLTN
jgi:hypothetical protein